MIRIVKVLVKKRPKSDMTYILLKHYTVSVKLIK